MHRAAQAAREAQQEFLHQLGVEIAHLFGGDLQRIAHGRPPADVHSRKDERLIHGQRTGAVAVDAGAITQRLAERAAQHDGDILHGMVIIHLHVAAAGEREVEPAVAAEQLQHMVQKTAARVHVVNA